MKEKPNIEELIADSMTLLLIRAHNLPNSGKTSNCSRV